MEQGGLKVYYPDDGKTDPPWVYKNPTREIPLLEGCIVRVGRRWRKLEFENA